MLNTNPFYFRILRKYVVLFGTLFNNITFVRYEKNGVSEIQRLKVPLNYAPKDKMVTRYLSDPDLLKSTQVTLPRMSFEITNIAYDATRKQNSLLKIAAANSGTSAKSQFMGVPYNIDFELTVYAKNVDDGNQIIEQILPYFNPDFTLTINPVAEVGFLKDIPIILDNVAQNVQYEGNFDSVRYVFWTLNFTLKGYFFGPVSTPKIIRKAITSIFNDASLVTGYITRINVGSGNGTFKIGDTVYQGDRFETATAFGIVNDWAEDNDKLSLGGVQGQFTVNNTIRAVSSNASYSIASFDATPLLLYRSIIEPSPLDAEPGDDYGYTITEFEFPDEPPA